jgi:hypothetical protein
VLALLDAGCDARAVVLIAKYPQDRMRNLGQMAVRALLGPGEEALTQFCKRLNSPWQVGSIVRLSTKALTEAGHGGVAAVLESEFPRYDRRRRSEIVEAEEAEGRRLAAKLRRCAPHLESP